MTDTLSPAREAVRATEPSKRWRNRWLVRIRAKAPCLTCGDVLFCEPGDEFITHCHEWPSRAEAEAEAARLTGVPGVERVVAYLGAFPVEA